MNSVQENKNELEAAVRYCESAISRAKATIESMEFRQQAASKAWHEQTGREAALQREVSELHKIRQEMQERIDELMLKDEERNTNMALMTDELEDLRGIIDRMGDDSTGDSVTITQLRTELDKLKEEKSKFAASNARLLNKQQEMEQTMQLQRDQIAMFQRKMSRMNEVDR